MAEVKGDEKGWKKIRRGWCLGRESFIGRTKEKLEEIAEESREVDRWAGIAVEEMEKDRAQRLLEQGAGILGYWQSGEIRGEDRYLLGKWIRRRTRVRVPWLAQKIAPYITKRCLTPFVTSLSSFSMRRRASLTSALTSSSVSSFKAF